METSFDRNRTGSWRALAGFDVLATLLSIFLGRHRVAGPFIAGIDLLEIPFQIGNAPTAPCASTAALADLAGSPQLVKPNEVDDLSFSNMKAVANCVIEFHESRPFTLPLS